MLRLLNTGLLVLYMGLAFSQGGTNKMKAHYRITAKKLASLEADGFPVRVKGDVDTRYALGDLKKFRFLATLKDGYILMDGWSVDTTLNENRAQEVNRGDTVIYINRNTPHTLSIDLNRPNLGTPTTVVKIPYQAWVITLNTLGVKVRPSATDSAGKTYAANVSTGFNLGLTAGYSFGRTGFTHRTLNSWSHTLGLGVGFSAVALGKDLLYSPTDVSDAPSNLVLSPNFSYTFARNDIGLVLAAGIDQMVGARADSWLYQSRFFWGFGLAVSLKV